MGWTPKVLILFETESLVVPIKLISVSIISLHNKSFA